MADTGSSTDFSRTGSLGAADQERSSLASDWLWGDDFHVPVHATITTGAEAATEGRALLEAALGGSTQLERAIAGGRADLSGTAHASPSPIRRI